MNMYTNEAIEALGYLHCADTYFRGVFHCQDLISEPEAAPRKNSAFIVNAAPSRTADGHFILITFRESAKVLHFFDSSGLPVLIYNDVCDYVLHFKLHVCIESRAPIQSALSTFCGLYCIGKMWMEHAGLSTNSYFKFFHRKPDMRNDVRILTVISALHDVLSSKE